MLHVLLAYGLIASAPPGVQPPAATITRPATAVTLGEALASIQSQTGLTLTTTLDPKSPLTLKRREGALWPLLTEVADAARGRLTVTQKGKAVVIVPRAEPRGFLFDPNLSVNMHPTRLSSIDGAFRVVAKQTVSRRDIEFGGGATELTLLVHWDPRLPVFRIDGEPRGKLEVHTEYDWPPMGLTYQYRPALRERSSVSGKVATSGHSVTSVMRIDAKVRDSGGGGAMWRIGNFLEMEGKFTVTAAAKMLQFRVGDTSKPTTLTQEGVTFTLQTPRKVGERWDVPVELVYPPSKVEFESFEAGVWLSRNKLQLIDPTGKPLDPMNEDFRESPGKANLVYRFPAGKVPADRAGWSLVYETPSPLVEFDVAFTLSNIPLP